MSISPVRKWPGDLVLLTLSLSCRLLRNDEQLSRSHTRAGGVAIRNEKIQTIFTNIFFNFLLHLQIHYKYIIVHQFNEDGSGDKSQDNEAMESTRIPHLIQEEESIL